MLINYVTGASPYTASLRIPSSSSVLVKYLVAPSTASHYNISWAGQTVGSNTSFSSDGTLSGTIQTTTIPCSNGVCNVQVPAPGIALVGLTPQATSAMAAAGATSTGGFPTTTAAVATVTIDQAALRTSNGMMGEVRAQDGQLGGTGPIKSLASTISAVTAGLLGALVLAVSLMQR